MSYRSRSTFFFEVLAVTWASKPVAGHRLPAIDVHALPRARRLHRRDTIHLFAAAAAAAAAATTTTTIRATTASSSSAAAAAAPSSCQPTRFTAKPATAAVHTRAVRGGRTALRWELRRLLRWRVRRPAKHHAPSLLSELSSGMQGKGEEDFQKLGAQESKPEQDCFNKCGSVRRVVGHMLRFERARVHHV